MRWQGREQSRNVEDRRRGGGMVKTGAGIGIGTITTTGVQSVVATTETGITTNAELKKQSKSLTDIILTNFYYCVSSTSTFFSCRPKLYSWYSVRNEVPPPGKTTLLRLYSYNTSA